MKILVFGLFAINAPHFETELEIMQRHLDDHDNLTFMACNAQLLCCEPNVQHNWLVCKMCVRKRNKGIELLSQPVTVLDFYDQIPANERQHIAQQRIAPATIAELRQLTVDKFDIGEGVLSSLVSHLRNPHPTLSEHTDLINRIYQSAYLAYRSLTHYLAAHQPDRVYIFNGRFATMRAAMRACQQANIPFFIHERGYSITHYALFDNHLPHSISHIEQRIRHAWQSPQPSQAEKTAIAQQFYHDRAGGKMQSWFSFVDQQQADLLPDNWDSNRRNMVLFNSSEDEFVAIGNEWRNHLYPDQLSGTRQIIADWLTYMQPATDHLYIRLHPNLRHVPPHLTAEWLALQSPFVTIIPPQSPISTYSLLRHAHCVLTFGSTVGIESAFWGKTSILLGQCFYKNLGSTYTPATHQQAMQLLANTQLPPLPVEGALQYAYYMNSFGTEFKYFEGSHIFDGKFKGKDIQPLRFLYRYRHLYKQSWVYKMFNWSGFKRLLQLK